MSDWERILADAVRQGASDIHLSSGQPLWLRLDGQLSPQGSPRSAAQVDAMLRSLMTPAQQEVFAASQELDFAISGAGARFRVNAFISERGSAAVLRQIPAAAPSLTDIAAPPVLSQLLGLTRGLVLITGPTGSGKSTTLAAMVRHLNESSARHILTIEDPIEFVHTPHRCLIHQREVGRHTHSFAAALKSGLRDDPDVILLGDMRDRETIALALTAAETGHLVLGTLHTHSAAKAIDRIIDVFETGAQNMARAMLSGTLAAVVAQRLLPRTGGGRVAAREILIATPAIRNLIREGATAQIASLQQVGRSHGMRTMRDAVNELVANGLVDPAIGQQTLAGLEGDGLLTL